MDHYEETGTVCYHCGNECSGDVTEAVDIDGMVAEFAICDDPDNCPAN